MNNKSIGQALRPFSRLTKSEILAANSCDQLINAYPERYGGKKIINEKNVPKEMCQNSLLAAPVYKSNKH